MLKRMQLFPLNFYKKEKFNGSIGEMNFRLARKEKEAEGEKTAVLQGIVWRGPYCFDVTPDEKKEYREFPFGEEGIQEAMEWFDMKGKEYNTM
ncbi:hypothetical protein NE683_03340 [Bariatricus massiliensis]|uniref:GNAT family acetyltransferase n=1 Tax=Bariatricus massiliensis TaxID=1745713 RepID=A0ABS8DDW7_9FIRM|nr:hypothetical protein [Bariatricus massiliensis]MCB7303495.1 hypothetical protein [Bariatricus massiliensis]MCB7373627.1 hypothetical protein [Bariatricus massiliensis]MCB7386297.1 hypothetical protein [Bariatricus massiliensis]MCB7410459.1 hypothetical protein [Bariatricus massiliensis]MCQ5252257.1 hypothetical protein [Bariatricus massiliensis]